MIFLISYVFLLVLIYIFNIKQEESIKLKTTYDDLLKSVEDDLDDLEVLKNN